MIARLIIIGLAVSAGWAGIAAAQDNGNQGNNQNNNASGILIDARGVVTPGFTNDQSSRLKSKRQRAWSEERQATDLVAFSECRKVSLVRLEEALRERVDAEQPLTDDVLHLAGLQRIDYLFADPARGDIVIAGPAEGFAPDASGRMRGLTTGRPPLLLDDALVAFRTLSNAREVGCSIDPAPQNLAALANFVARNSSPATPAVIERRFQQMAATLGLHDVRVMGVPSNSHFGRVLVEADYRMKRISLGLENPQVKGLNSHLSMLSGGGNSVQRWWFVPLYDALYRSEDRLAFEITGPRMQLLSQEELTDGAGRRQAAATTRLTTQAFARQFTERFAALADQSPVFAELQGLTDWCLLIALLDEEQLPQKVGWTAEFLKDAARLPHAQLTAPERVPAMVNSKRASSGLVVGLVGGGVTIETRTLLRAIDQPAGDTQRLAGLREANLASPRSAEHPWWWD